MSKIIYILGTGYCGSTALELCLGANSKIVSLGEIDRLLNKTTVEGVNTIYDNTKYGGKHDLCACGSRMKSCDYWKGFYEIIIKNVNKSFNEKYHIHYEYFTSYYGKDTILVDSSKSLSTLKKLTQEVKDEFILPIFLIKDIRNWTTSVQAKHGGVAFKRYIRWYLENKKFKNFLEDKNYLQIGYEEFALFPNRILQEITNKVNIKYSDEMLVPGNSTSHSILANKMRYDDQRLSQVYYDYRWMENDSLNFASLVLKFIMNFNYKEVYSNKIIERNFNYGK